MNGRTLDTSDFTFLQFDDLGLETAPLAPAQEHAQQHIRPVLGFCAARARLDVEIGVILIHFTGEHAAKLEFLQVLLKPVELRTDIIGCLFVFFFGSHFDQFFGIVQTFCQLVDGADNQFKV